MKKVMKRKKCRLKRSFFNTIGRQNTWVLYKTSIIFQDELDIFIELSRIYRSDID